VPKVTTEHVSPFSIIPITFQAHIHAYLIDAKLSSHSSASLNSILRSPLRVQTSGMPLSMRTTGFIERKYQPKSEPENLRITGCSADSTHSPSTNSVYTFMEG